MRSAPVGRAIVKRLVIIGAGISGLAATHRLLELSNSGHQISISVLEASSRLGGIVETTRRDGFLLELGPDSFISEKPEALELSRRLGLESRLIETNPQFRRSFIVRGGRLRPVPEGFQLLAPSRLWPFIATDIFSLPGKARMAADLFLPRRSANGSADADDESLASFVRRRLGTEALERMAQPMVGGIYTADPERLSLRATLPRFLDFESQHRSIILAMWKKRRASLKEDSGVSGARYSLFLSFDKGMRVIVDALTNRIAEFQLANDAAQPAPAGRANHTSTDIRLNTQVTSVRRKESANELAPAWEVATKGGELFAADVVCLAVPSYVAASLIANADASLAQKLRQITYASTATVNLAYRRRDIRHRLDGFGFVVPYVERRALIACTFSSIKFPSRAPEDHVLLRAFVGGALQPQMFALEDSEMVHRVKSDLGELLGIQKEPLFVEVAKWRESMPQYEVGHLVRIAAIESDLSRLPGLNLAGNSYKGAGIPDCIRSGERAAEKLWRYLGS
jgi:protoporphyrinogen/coproporphyrinogen III oxidase